MRKGKDDEKVMKPMFPRLHVNDTEKGGPRAPPRNKMALYEQLSIPSQRFNNTDQQQQSLPVNPIVDKFISPSLSIQGGSVGEEDDYTVPTYFQPDMGQCKSTKSSSSYTAHSMLIQHSSGNSPKQTGSPNLDSKRQNGANLKDIRYATKTSLGEKIVRPVKPVNASTYQRSSDITIDNLRRSDSDASSHQKYFNTLPQDDGHFQSPSDEARTLSGQGSAFRQRGGSCLEDPSSSPEEPFIDNDCLGDQAHVSHLTESGDRSDDASENSMVDSGSGSDISPDDVVEIIGYEHFLRARKAITNQQRLFALQVFELHRLVKVQKLFAGSPHFLVEDGSYLDKTSSNHPPVKKYVNKSLSPVVKRNRQSESPNNDKECTAENGMLLPHHRSNSGQPPPTPVATDAKMVPWCIPQPPGQQWLVPIMSPSEGLVYKPCSGPKFTDQGYGGCEPMGGAFPNMPPQGNFMHPAYSVPSSHPLHHQGMTSFPGAFPVGYGPYGYPYFPPYGMPVESPAPAPSGSSVEQMNPFAGTVFHSQTPPLPTDGSVYSNLQHRSSCNTSGQKSYSISQSVKPPTRKEDLRVSTASSSRKKARVVQAPAEEVRDALSLFPVNPTIPEVPSQQPSDEPDEPARVIRVVPHNPRTANESAARIFQSIQEERRQFEWT